MGSAVTGLCNRQTGHVCLCVLICRKTVVSRTSCFALPTLYAGLRGYQHSVTGTAKNTELDKKMSSHFKTLIFSVGYLVTGEVQISSFSHKMVLS